MRLAHHQPECVLDVKAMLGEGPVWSEAEKAFYFVDILGRKIHRYTPAGGRLKSWDTPDKVGFLLPITNGCFLAGMPDGLHGFNPQTGQFAHACAVEPDYPGNRLNDGCVDQQGRIWFGTMDDEESRDSGAIYRVVHTSEGLEVTDWDSGYIVSNGPALSPCGRRLYACDSPRRLIYVFDLDDEGNLLNRRVFARFKKGYPDGIVTDSAGNLWCGTWGGGQITRFTADGEALEPIKMPVTNVTKPAFGGEDYRTVVVTTARKGLQPHLLEKEPLAGGLFAFTTDVPGHPQALFRLGA